MVIETRFVLPEWAMPASEDQCSEQWAEVDYGYYVSDMGRIWSGKTQQFLTPKRMDKQGHVGVVLNHGEHKAYKYLHRLIAEEFVPNPENLPIVRHLNDDPKDNRVENLAWGTQRDNAFDAIENGGAYLLTDEDREKSYEKSRTPIIAINLKTGERTRFRGQGEAGSELGIQTPNIWKVLHGQRHSAGGYTFEWE